MIKKLINTFLFLIFFYSTGLFAEPASNSNSDKNSNDIKALTLTSAQIKKLDKLFDIRESDAVPDFNQSPQPEHVVWQQSPINIVLPVGKERTLTFPESTAFGYDKNILPLDTLRIQNNNGTVYLLAKKSFSSQRVGVKLVNSGKIILLNLSAQKEADATPLNIVMPEDKLSTETKENTHNDDSERANKSADPVMLMRFAIQQLYAPKRLLTAPSNIYRSPMHLYKTISLLRDESVIAMPLASWKSGNLTVTAILLRNILKQSLQLDPRLLCGNWQAVSFYPRNLLLAAGAKEDSTTVFLIANQSASQALKMCVTQKLAK